MESSRGKLIVKKSDLAKRMKGPKYTRVPPEMPRGRTMPNMTFGSRGKASSLHTPNPLKNLTYVKNKEMTKEGSNGRLYAGAKVAGGWQNR